MGKLRLEQGDIHGARDPIETSVSTLQALVNKDPDDVEWRGNLAEAQLDGARLAIASKQPLRAKQLAISALNNLRKPLKDNPSSIHTVPVEAQITLTLADIADDTDNADAARLYRQQALAQIRAVSAHSSDPRKLAILAEALLASGKQGDAKPYIVGLQKIGYRPASFVARLQKYGITYPSNPQFNVRVAQLLQSDAPNPNTAHPHP